MKVAVFSTKSYDERFLTQFNKEKEIEFTFFETSLKRNTSSLAKGYKAVCVFVNDHLNASCLEKLAANGVKLIALRCAGFNNVDLKRAKALGLKVVRVPAYSPEAVAEHALALILTLSRKTHKAYNRIRENNFSLEKLLGFNIHGKTVGVIGTGTIGAIFAKMMQGMGCKVICYDKYPNDKLNLEYVELDELYKESDIISLHCPLTPETKHLFNKDTFELLKPSCMLVNTSRGALIDSKAAIHALKKKQLGNLAIDVYEQEADLFFEDLSDEILQDETIGRLMSFPNVLITAHQGFFTEEALTEIAQVTIENLKEFDEGKELSNEVKQ